MADSASERNLLLGLLALQFNFVTQEALADAVRVWQGERDTPLGDVLRRQGALDDEAHALLAALAARHLQAHGGDVRASLAALKTPSDVLRALAGVAGENLLSSLAPGTVQTDPYATRPPEDAPLPPFSSARFEVIRPHARGGLGQVSLALDRELRRAVALKEIQERYADDPDSRARFLLEAEVTGGLVEGFANSSLYATKGCPV
jgi:serine/threonine-protein kinase